MPLFIEVSVLSLEVSDHVCVVEVSIASFYDFPIAGAFQDFKLGGALKKIAPSAGRREHFWSISCEKSRFYAKRSYFFQFWGGVDPLLYWIF